MTGHVVVAPAAFKGSLSARDVAAALAAGLRAAAPQVPVITVPVADGGDGTLDVALAAGFARIAVRASGPTGEPVDTGYAIRDGVAVVELADACGLLRLPGHRPAPLTASSAGAGEVMRAAADAGCRRMLLGVGGSASTDGGAGLLAALGARILDGHGRPVPPGGRALDRVELVELSGLHPWFGRHQLVLASDVDNPLLGPHGAAAVYGPQKGADPDAVAQLDRALARWSAAVAAARGEPAGRPGHPAADRPGAGAAGGVGFAALAALGATVQPGIDVVLDITDLRRRLPGARLVVTGEGTLDAQTLRGKAPAGVAAAARACGVPVVAVAGRVALPAEQLRAAGIAAAYALLDLEPDPSRAIAGAGPLLERLAVRLAGDWLAGERLTT